MTNIKANKCIWDLAYCMFFLSFFLDDVAFVSETTQQTIIKIIRYCAYLVFLFLIILQEKRRLHQIVFFVCGMGIALVCSLFTRDLYYETLFLVIIISYNISPKHIVKISYRIMIIFTFVTIIGALIHVIPMVNSPRRVGEPDRFGLGFYHSDVLPLIFFYLIVYRIMIDDTQISILRVISWIVITLILYRTCGSKNGLLANMMLSVVYLLYRKKKEKEHKILLFIAKNLVVILAAFSIFAMIIQGTGSPLANMLNRLMTNRFYLSYRQMKTMGLHFVNTMDAATYIQTREVLDNGYLYVALRYGLLFLPFYWLVHIMLSKKHRRVPLILTISAVLSITNMIDNDLFSYGYLPIILVAFNRSGIEKTIKQRKGNLYGALN